MIDSAPGPGGAGGDPAAVGLHDPRAMASAQARAPGLGRVERLEEVLALLGGQPGRAVDPHAQCAGRPSLQRAALQRTRSAHGSPQAARAFSKMLRKSRSMRNGSPGSRSRSPVSSWRNVAALPRTGPAAPGLAPEIGQVGTSRLSLSGAA